MITVAQTVEDILTHDDLAASAARRGWLNLSSYARSIQPEVQKTLLKDVSQGTIVAALARTVGTMTPEPTAPSDIIQNLSVHSSLEGMTYERTAELSVLIGNIYKQASSDHKTFLTVTQGINEITVIAETRAAQLFRDILAGSNVREIYDKTDLVGITVTFILGNLEVPNLIYTLIRRLAYKEINIIEVVSTATELTFLIERKDLSLALEQLQKDI